VLPIDYLRPRRRHDLRPLSEISPNFPAESCVVHAPTGGALRAYMHSLRDGGCFLAFNWFPDSPKGGQGHWRRLEWMELCDRVSKEQNFDKLMAVIEEIDRP
jgi:hypothetical protein